MNLKHFFHHLPHESRLSLASTLSRKGIIAHELQSSLSHRFVVMEFLAGLYVNQNVSTAIQYCRFFLEAFLLVGGACYKAALFLAKLWSKAILNDFGVHVMFIPPVQELGR